MTGLQTTLATGPGNGPRAEAFKSHADHRLTTLLSVAAVPLVAGAAFAQAPSPAPNEATPGAEPTAPVPNLSEELSQSNGIIHPKEVDPAIQKPAPKTGDPNVVPPPGTSGGVPAPQPK
jgi:hypothetical protein